MREADRGELDLREKDVVKEEKNKGGGMEEVRDGSSKER